MCIPSFGACLESQVPVNVTLSRAALQKHPSSPYSFSVTAYCIKRNPFLPSTPALLFVFL